MKAEGVQLTKTAEPAALIFAEEPVGVIFDDGEAVAAGQVEDRVHFAADASIVDRHDGLSARGQECFESCFVEIQGVRTDIAENRFGAAQDESVDGRDEGEGGHDDFIAGLEFEKKSGHLEGVSAGGSEQGFVNAQFFFEQIMALAGEETITGDMPAFNCLSHVAAFLAGEARPVEWNLRRLRHQLSALK